MAYDGRSMMVFGGHRLWHGFATDNSEANSWSSYAEYPRGGYLEDLWVYTKKQLAEEEQAWHLNVWLFGWLFHRRVLRGRIACYFLCPERGVALSFASAAFRNCCLLSVPSAQNCCHAVVLGGGDWVIARRCARFHD